MKLNGKHVYITGSNRGMGFEFALQAAKSKAHVHLVNRSPVSDDQVEKLRQTGAESVNQVQLDLGDSRAIQSFLDDVRSKPVDVIINNAGLLTGGLIEKQDFADIEKMLQVNLNAVIQLSQGLIPQMVEQKSGYIVNNASVSGKMFFPCASTYAASKAGVVAFTQSIHQELKGTGVQTLLLITPGVKTKMYDDISKLYGENLDLSFMDSIPAADWAYQVFECIDEDEDICYPSGSSRFGVWLGHHAPKIFQKITQSKFHR